MKLRTSFCNGTILKKDITRYAPIWSLYCILLLILLTIVGDDRPARMGADMLSLIQLMLWVNLFYAGICANVLFGDLFNSRMCYALHAMPLRRESWMGTHILSGFLFSFVPNLAATVIMCVMLRSYQYLALCWLAAATMQYLFFYGIAVFSVMCAGNRLGMSAVYIILHFLGGIVYVIAGLFYEPLLYGIRLNESSFLFFSPVIHLTRARFVRFYLGSGDNGILEGYDPNAWIYLGVIAAIGIAAFIGALLIYRRRKLEAAGDFMALRSLRPVFLLIYTAGMSVVFYGLSEIFGYERTYWMLGLGLIVGFFTGKMLLARTVSVFRPKAFLHLGILIAVVALSLGITKLDPLGITRYVPDVDEIAWMQVYDSSDYYIYEDPEDNCWKLTDPESIAYFQQIHRDLIEQGGETNGEFTTVQVHYVLKNGRTVLRHYPVSLSDPHAQELEAHFSDYRYLFQTEDWNQLLHNTYEIEVSLNDYGGDDYRYSSFPIQDDAQVQALMEAIKQDCDDADMAQEWIFHPNVNYNGWLLIRMYGPEGKNVIDMSFYPSANHVCVFLTEYLNTHPID